MTDTFTKTLFLTQPVTSSRVRELQWQLSWWKTQKEEAQTAARNAWRIYQEAVDQHCTKDEIDELRGVAEMFDSIAVDAWHKEDDAKRDYLALMN